MISPAYPFVKVVGGNLLKDSFSLLNLLSLTPTLQKAHTVGNSIGSGLNSSAPFKSLISWLLHNGLL